MGKAKDKEARAPNLGLKIEVQFFVNNSIFFIKHA